MKTPIIRRKANPWPMRVALLISVLFCTTVLVWFVNNDDLRKHHVTLVIEPEKQNTDEEDKERDEEEDEREEEEEPEASEEDLEEVKEHLERKKTQEIKEELEDMEELKEEMEEMLEAKLAELPEHVEQDFFQEMADQLIEDTKQLREDLRKEGNEGRKALGNQEFANARQELTAMAKMNPLEQVQEFSEKGEQLASDLREYVPKGQEDEQEMNRGQHGIDEEHQQRMDEFSERAQDLADRARSLMNMDMMEALQPGMALEEMQPQDMAGLSPQEMYDYAQQLEQNLNQDFAAHQALDMAAVTGTNLMEAMSVLPQSFAQRADLNEALGMNTPQSVSQLQAYNQALEQAASETGRMRMAAQSKVRNAQGRTSQGQEGQQLMQARQNMAQAAAQQGSNGYADFSQTMRQAMVNMGSNQGGSHAARNVSGDMGHTQGMGQGQGQQKIKLPRNIQRDALPGRKFTSDATRRGWLFLDTWYIIGPWEKTGKMFEKPHPPEIEVDLDAEYAGKTIRKQTMTLRWRFLQSNSVRITPYEHTGGSVYYGYTEVYAEEPMEALLAVASDDGIKVWINDMVVHQDTGLSPWRMDEGFRKVFLKQGYNEVLIRLENGPNVAHFSVLLCPADLAKG